HAGQPDVSGALDGFDISQPDPSRPVVSCDLLGLEARIPMVAVDGHRGERHAAVGLSLADRVGRDRTLCFAEGAGAVRSGGAADGAKKEQGSLAYAARFRGAASGEHDSILRCDGRVRVIRQIRAESRDEAVGFRAPVAGLVAAILVGGYHGALTGTCGDG